MPTPVPFRLARLTILLCLCAGHPAWAIDADLAIVAIVNDKVVSSADLDDRITLALRTTGKPDTPALRKQAHGQILQSLIDEQLKLQEAERFSILISPDDVDAAIGRIEQGQQKPSGSLQGMIEQEKLSVDSFRTQIRSEVAWQKLLARKVRSEVDISDEEVKRAQERMARGKKVDELQIASIILPFDASQNEEEMLGIARDIRSQLVKGAHAPELLKAYQARVKLEFGPLSWVQKDMLNPLIAETVTKIKVGEIAEPIRTPIGYQIIRLLDQRSIATMPSVNAEVALKQIILKLDNQSADREIDAMMSIARSMSKYPGSCTEKGIAGMRDAEGLNVDVNYIRTTLVSMSPEVRRLVEPLPLTGITEPFAAPDGIHLLMLCEKITMPLPLPDKDEVKQVLFEEKMQLEAEKYLRRLRREAFIDIRV